MEITENVAQARRRKSACSVLTISLTPPGSYDDARRGAITERSMSRHLSLFLFLFRRSFPFVRFSFKTLPHAAPPAHGASTVPHSFVARSIRVLFSLIPKFPTGSPHLTSLTHFTFPAHVSDPSLMEKKERKRKRKRPHRTGMVRSSLISFFPTFADPGYDYYATWAYEGAWPWRIMPQAS